MMIIPLCVCVCVCVFACWQVFLCHDHDTGRELAVKVVDIEHIDHMGPTNDSVRMQRVRWGCGMRGWVGLASVTCEYI